MSFHLGYREYNTFFTNTMTDEVRKMNDHLYLGMGRLTATFGKFNPMLMRAFVILCTSSRTTQVTVLEKN